MFRTTKPSRMTKPERIQHWLDRLNRHAASQLTVAEFCEREAVSLPSFYQWKRRLTPRIESATKRRKRRLAPSIARSSGNCRPTGLHRTGGQRVADNRLRIASWGHHDFIGNPTGDRFIDCRPPAAAHREPGRQQVRVMLNFPGRIRIFVHTGATDMRKGFSGLSAIVREQFESDPTDGSLFIFINRRRDRMKLLHFADGGFWLYYRLLEAGTFEVLKSTDDSAKLQIDATELSMLLSGVSLAASANRRKRYAG